MVGLNFIFQKFEIVVTLLHFNIKGAAAGCGERAEQSEFILCIYLKSALLCPTSPRQRVRDKSPMGVVD